MPLASGADTQTQTDRHTNANTHTYFVDKINF